MRDSTHSQSNISEIGRNMQTLSKKESEQLRNKKTLNIYDYKKFKYMKDVQSRYTFGKVLGQGAFGLVRYCTHRATNT